MPLLLERPERVERFSQFFVRRGHDRLSQYKFIVMYGYKYIMPCYNKSIMPSDCKSILSA